MSSTESTAIEGTTAPYTRIAGFWRRLFAFFLDSILLGIAGSFLGLILFDYLAGMGGWGRLIGFTVALMYFGLMDSRLFNGQTLGKKVLKIKVVSREGTSLNVPASFSRSIIFCVPYFLNGAPIAAEVIQSWIGALLSIIVFGLGISIAYLLIFNRQTRQSVHDLAVGAFIVKTAGEDAPVAFGKLWRGHFVVPAIILAVATAAPIFSARLTESESFLPLVALQKDITREPGVRNASVLAGATAFTSSKNGTHSSTNLSVRVISDSRDTNQEVLADRIVQITLSKYPAMSNKNVIAVSIAYGYDIGIASSWRSANFVHPTIEWQKRLAPKSGKAKEIAELIESNR